MCNTLYCLVLGSLLLNLTSAITCEVKRNYAPLYTDTAPSEFGVLEDQVMSRVMCSATCYTRYNENCDAFFYNEKTKTCRIFDFSKIWCLTLFKQHGTVGYVDEKALAVPKEVCPYVTSKRHPLQIPGPSDRAVYGDFDSEGWLVIQRRERNTFYFNKTWKAYLNGFSEREDMWLGNMYLHLLTRYRRYKVRFRFEYKRGGSHTEDYGSFSVAGANDNYRLNLGYPSPANTESWLEYCHGKTFSTYDRDNDNSETNCALKFGAGWWFGSCVRLCLTCSQDTFKYYIDEEISVSLTKIRRTVY